MKKIIMFFSCLCISMYGLTGCAAEVTQDWAANTGEIDLSSRTATGDGVAFNGTTVLVTKGGDFTVTGTLEDGMIRVNSDSKVKLRLSGVSITNASGPAIYFENAQKALITLTENTGNTLSDGTSYSEDLKGTLFSNDDLEIKGNGSLTITGNYNHGIVCDDSLSIENGNITVNAAGDALHANDDINISGGSLLLTAVGDGLQSDGSLTVSGGDLSVSTTGDPSQADASSTKGIKAETSLVISAGSLNVASADHALHSADSIEISGGSLTLNSAAGKGISGHGNVTVSGGDIEILNSTEGIESKAVLTVNDGNIRIRATDDGLNSGGDNGGLMGGGFRLDRNGQTPPEQGGGTMQAPPEITPEGEAPQQGHMRPQQGEMPPDGMPNGTEAAPGGNGAPKNTEAVSSGASNNQIVINGGTIYINADGDGIDSNGTLTFHGGDVIIDGPTSGGDGALDSEGIMTVNGGTLIAVGSAGMAQAPDSGSSQNAVRINFSSLQTAGTVLTLKDNAGTELLSHTPAKNYQSLVFSSPGLAISNGYTVFVDGNELESFTLSDTITNVGTEERGGMGGMRGGGQPGDNLPSRDGTGNIRGLNVSLNGTAVSFGRQPVMQSDRILVPYGPFLEALGLTAEWDEEARTLTVAKDEITLVFTNGGSTASVDGTLVSLDVPPVFFADTLYIPLRFTAESLGFQVSWNEAAQTAAVSSRSGITEL